MAGQWQREFFLITEDPFAVDLFVFDLWLEGYSVREAADIRRTRLDEVGATPSGALESRHGCDTARDGSAELFEQFGDLLLQDCAQQYEAFEFLEGALADPVRFLEFCPVQLAPSIRREFVTRYYSLHAGLVREMLKMPNALLIRGCDRKAQQALEQIARVSGQKVLKVQRILANLQRVCQWVEVAAWQLTSNSSGPATAASAVAVGSLGAQSAPSAGTMATLPFLPLLQALGEPLRWRYRSLAFVMLCRFDLWSRAALPLHCHTIEDIAAILLSSGGVMDAASNMTDVRCRIVEVLTWVGRSLGGGGVDNRSPRLSASGSRQGSHCSTNVALEGSVGVTVAENLTRVGSAGSSVASAALVTPESVDDSLAARAGQAASTARACGVLGSQIRECLKEVEAKVLRPKYNEFKSLFTQEVEKHSDTPQTQTSALGDESLPIGFRSSPSSRTDWSRGFFPRTNRYKTTRLDPTLAALTAGVASLNNPSAFENFFGVLVEFSERLRQLGWADPLELFECCYVAMEVLSEREQAVSKKTLWPARLKAWRAFLEFYRACVACILLNPSPNGSETSMNDGRPRGDSDPFPRTRTDSWPQVAQSPPSDTDTVSQLVGSVSL
eukprot:TRINITY_DN62318_c0_g1_i1.p1 TRINITY_DN62318_c0_g1~~TRINITY_DN62318_c0_g1_i1.p1  ORF type:complete len:613 (+),score=91.96 TRINITY_DN62318_c0_g1_i1:173-2011(+)